jgi:hypothetical protein
MNSRNNNEPQVALNQQEIATRAYLAWEKAGRPEGRDLDFWLEAGKQLRATRQPPEVIPSTEKTTRSGPKRGRSGRVKTASRVRNGPLPSVLTIGAGR